MSPGHWILLAVLALALWWWATKTDFVLPNGGHLAVPGRTMGMLPANTVLPNMSLSSTSSGYGNCGKQFTNGLAVPACQGSATFSQQACNTGGSCGCWV